MVSRCDALSGGSGAQATDMTHERRAATCVTHVQDLQRREASSELPAQDAARREVVVRQAQVAQPTLDLGAAAEPLNAL